MAERQEQSKLNAQEAQGDARTQDLERSKNSTLLGMSQSDVAAQGAKVAAADSKMWSGITGAAGALSSGLTGMAGGMGGGTPGDMSAGQTIYDANGSPMSPVQYKNKKL